MMQENHAGNEGRRHDPVYDEDAAGLWQALGLEDAKDYTAEEMIEILGQRLNRGEISGEEINAAVKIAQSRDVNGFFLK